VGYIFFFIDIFYQSDLGGFAKSLELQKTKEFSRFSVFSLSCQNY